MNREERLGVIMKGVDVMAMRLGFTIYGHGELELIDEAKQYAVHKLGEVCRQYEKAIQEDRLGEHALMMTLEELKASREGKEKIDEYI